MGKGWAKNRPVRAIILLPKILISIKWVSNQKGEEIMKKIIALVMCLALFPLAAYSAGSNEVKIRSQSTARVLSLLPINSPAAFYTGRPVRGTVYSLLEGGGLTAVGMGTYLLVSLGNEPSGNDIGTAFGWLGYGMVKGLGIGLVALGAIAWAPPWIHTVVKASDWTDDYNEKSLKKVSATVSPIVSYAGPNSIYGVNLGVRF